MSQRSGGPQAGADVYSDEQIDQMLERLRPVGPVPRAPALPAPRRFSWPLLGGVALAAAALVALGLPRDPPSPDPEPGLRGEAAAGPGIDLRVAVKRGEELQRLHSGGTYAVGDRLYFRLSSPQSRWITLWIDGPEGRVALGHHEAGPTPADLRAGEGVLAWSLDRPGTYTVRASADGMGRCAPESCVERAVVVK